MSIAQLIRDNFPEENYRLHDNSHFTLYFGRVRAEHWLLRQTSAGAAYHLYYLATMDTDTYQFTQVIQLLSTYGPTVVPLGDWFREFEFAEELSCKDLIRILDQ